MEKQIADQIITSYFKKIYGFAIKKSYSYEEAEDLCSEIVQQVYESLIKSAEIINVEGYIWRISEYTYSKYVSSKKKQRGISIDGIDIPYEEAFTYEDSEEDAIRLRREIAYLTEIRRKIVYLFYYKNHSISYISNELSIPEGTIKWHLNKARIELKEGFYMERKIGKLGMSPITAITIGHSGDPGSNEGPEYYLGDKLNLNIVYSVYHNAKTREEIAEELGVTPVFIDDKINFLEGNGFLVKTKGNRYTTYVCFEPEEYSLELSENRLKKQQKAAEMIVNEYVPLVRAAVADLKNDTYIPSGNWELLEAAAIFYGVMHKCGLATQKDLSKYRIKTTAGGDFIAFVHLPCVQSDPEYKVTLDEASYRACGSMTRQSEKYPAVFSWSIDSRYCSRKGYWQNNRTCDYEYLYEFLCGNLPDNAANADKYARLREREFLNEKNQFNVMIMKKAYSEFCDKIPTLRDELKNKFADFALESSMIKARNYPIQMRDLIVNRGVSGFIGTEVAMQVMDILYQNGTFKTLTEREKITAHLIMFSDILPECSLFAFKSGHQQ